MGPLGGILTAMLLHREAAWFVLGCDLPFIDTNIINTLAKQRDPLKMATAYVDSIRDFIEPLCTIYEPKIRPRFFQFLGLGYKYPLKALMNSEIKKIFLKDGYKLKNVNTQEDFQEAYEILRNRDG
jgi:molybdopterin-guanine dinucleotide biosynthesis protein A